MPAAPAPRSQPSSQAVLAAVAAGGAIGAVARHGLAAVLPHGHFAWSTLAVNLTGCLLIGVLMVLITEVRPAHPLVRPFLGVGVLGGFTTFSTYIADIRQALDAGAGAAALAYLVLTVTGAVAAVWAGASLTRLAAAAVPRRAAEPAGEEGAA
ncbi:CrcB protein [Thermocatellispora tengchongensis]|uniref:Fluoride-specific ion channel FluC n=1 Tax=Thermocatellispora tengchongensis TaxID=1073253 RepID=A0A840P113_9ACTN|nr:CrcB family protein [Thermocatellispora tengchongensis]MBB5132156.1 CrcB protein [Thermocatellispora tengchongensis]